MRLIISFRNTLFLLVSLILCFGTCHQGLEYTVEDGKVSEMLWSDIELLKPDFRVKREASTLAPNPTVVTTTIAPAPDAKPAAQVVPSRNISTVLTTVPPTVTKQPLLGANGTGILRVNLTKPMTTVSDPIPADDNFTENYFKETIKAEHNLTNLNYDSHNFYNSTFIGNKTYFDEHWKNITKTMPEMHPVLSDSHRKATTLKLKFDFPFYGHPLRNITVATGGFIYTGEHVHNWLAATQYIAPLMANFDTTLTPDSAVKLLDDGEKFTALWENATLQEDKTKKFTFAVTLYQNGDIVFAYKDIPMSIATINDKEHPVKVGISDAYITDRILFYARRKTIYEYHRVSFKDHEITNSTILKLVALPTCLQYTTCESCVNHDTGFNCSWCNNIQRCSSGTDRNKQDWLLRNCEKSNVYNVSSCPAPGHGSNGNMSTAYITDNADSPMHKTDIRAAFVPATRVAANKIGASNEWSQPSAGPQAHSAIGGVVAAFVIIVLVSSLAAWVVYAFKNPHTRSGQILIKYRPSQWNWKRGEARYTAATIHM